MTSHNMWFNINVKLGVLYFSTKKREQKWPSVTKQHKCNISIKTTLVMGVLDLEGPDSIPGRINLRNELLSLNCSPSGI